VTEQRYSEFECKVLGDFKAAIQEKLISATPARL
jgi:hypothetical protein